MSNKRKMILILIVLLAVGFATVSTTLVLNGTIGVGSNEDDFDVIFTDAIINGEDSEVTINDTKKKITFTSSKLTKIGEKAILDYKIKNNSTQYDANVSINCTTDTSEYIGVTSELAGEKIIENYQTTLLAQEEKSGVITAELIKTTIKESDSIEITCEIVANAVERNNAVEIKESKWIITEDNDENGEVSFGDLITLGTEDFYVYNTNGDTVKAIRKDPLDCGAIEFSTTTITGATRTTYEGSQIQGKVNDYLNTLDEEAGIVEARLISKDELEILGCSSEKASCKAGYVINSSHEYVDDETFVGAPEWIYSANIWTMTAADNNNAWRVLVQGNFDTAMVPTRTKLNVRPVVIISKEAL